MIPCSNPKAQYQTHQSEIDKAVTRVLHSGWYILGQEVEAFEKEFARYIGVPHGIGVGSGTAALHLALATCGVGQGDEVITVSHTAVATVSAIVSTGATPVFVDIEPDYYTIDPAAIKTAITAQTRAIVVVHLYGQAADLTPILKIAKENDLRVIEDCAQAHGAKYQNKRVGAYGDVACFSFYPTKNLGALGDGGMMVTSNQKLADKAMLLRQYGWSERFVSQLHGWNTRLDEIQAAVLRVKLKYLDQDNAKRIALAEGYTQALSRLNDIILPKHRASSTHVSHQYVLRTPYRDKLLTHLRENKIGAAIHYPVPVHEQPAYQCFRQARDLHHTVNAVKEILSLPMYPELSSESAKCVTDTVCTFFSQV
ncbi:DegT/DnrJ/EryC1/StrS family aminotransferase [Planctomycetota bacterium]